MIEEIRLTKDDQVEKVIITKKCNWNISNDTLNEKIKEIASVFNINIDDVVVISDCNISVIIKPRS